MRELRAITRARCARSSRRAGYGEVSTPALEYEDDARARRRARRAAGLPPVRRAGRRAGAALGHDGADRAARRDALRDAEPPLRFCYFAHAYRGVRPQRGQAREFLQAGIELVGAPGAGRDGRGADACCATRSTPSGLRRLPHRARRRRRSTRRCSTATASPAQPRERMLHELVTRDFVGLEREVAALRLPTRRPRRCCACRSCAAAGGARRARRAGGARPAAGCASVHDAARAARRRAGDLRPRAARARSATTRARSSRSTTRRSACRSAAAGATTTCSGASAAPLPAVGWALNVERLHIALVGEERAGRAVSARRPDDRGPARRAVRRDARPARRARRSTPARCAPTTASCCSRDVGIVTMRPSDVPTYVEAGAADIGITGKDVLMRAVRARGLRAARPRLRRAARWCSPPSPATTRRRRRCAGSA